MKPARLLRPRALLAALLWGTVLAAASNAPAWADDDTLVAQRRIEAAYLFKFGAYISWPATSFASQDSPLVIGVAGDDDMADELSTLVAGRNVNGRPVVVKTVRSGQDTQGMHLLFVAAGTEHGDAMIQALHNRPTVTVTEGAGGLGMGADVTFVLVNDRVRFDIALDVAERDGVKMSSQLLSVADKVIGAKP
ncbi:MAG TPA: YfiR family protein [Gammaproteobacteria bacterium]|nr:YfiR family protein [Gammaproteobacteria bacterium]